MTDLAGTLKRLRKDRDRAAHEAERLDQAIRVLEGIVGGKRGASRFGRSVRRMSAAGRRRIAAAQKARWAKWKAKHGKAA